VGADIKETYSDWGAGVVTSMEPDEVPQNAYTRGRNVALTSIGGGKAAVRRRNGVSTLNATAITGGTAIVGMHEYRRRGASSFTAYRLVVSDNGRLDRIDPDDGTLTSISTTAFTSSTSQERTPSFADANNLCFIVNGTEQKKYNGTDLQTFGIAAPASAPTIADAGDAGNHNGTYEARVTYYNSATGQESSAGTTSSAVSITNSSINWTNIPVSADAQVTSRRLYLRNTGTMNNFYLAGTVANNSATTASTNLLDSSLTVVGPDADENDPPPSTGRYVFFHKSRLFVLTTTDVHFSKLAALPNGDTGVESFDPENFETPTPENGQVITGGAVAFDALIIFKTNSIVALEGDDPETWTLRELSSTIGCTSHRSIVVAGGRVFFWSEQGPAVLAGLGEPELIGPPFIGDTISPSNLSYSQTPLTLITAAPELHEQRILWAVPEVSQTRNTLILPFNYRINRWESDGWDPMDASCLAALDDGNGISFIALGGYGGQVFKFEEESGNDGIATGTTHTGTFVATATSMTTFTDSSATFDTTGAGLVERKVTIVDSNGNRPEIGIRPRITSNTATTFTVNASVDQLVEGATYTYYIGGPAVDFESAWLHQGDPFLKKRYRFVYYHIRMADVIDNLRFNVYTSYQLDDDITLLHEVALDEDFEYWDEVDWDTALWSGENSSIDIQDRFRVGRVGTAILVRIRHYEPDAALTILKLGVVAETLSEKLG
jgi:hypothetical protein